MSTLSNAIEKRTEQPAGNQVIEKYRGVFADVLPTHIKPETWVRVAQGALRRNEDLALAAARNPESLIAALLDAARRGLEPGTEQYYLVPLKGAVNGWVGYQGEIELMYRAGAISSVIVDVIREKDIFRYRRGIDERPYHEIDWFADDRGALKGVYAYAVMKDGSTSHVVVMNRSEVMEHKAMAMGANRDDSPWKKWEKSMWLKTAVHELAKWVPTSAEYLTDQARAAGEMIRHANKPTSGAPVAPQPPQPGRPQQEERQEPIRATVIDGEATEGQPAERPMTENQSRQMFATFNHTPMNDKDSQLDFIAQVIGRRITSRKDLTFTDANLVIDALEQYIANNEPPAGGEQS